MWTRLALILLFINPTFLIWLNSRNFDSLSIVALTLTSVAWFFLVLYLRHRINLSATGIVILWLLTRSLSLLSGHPSVDDDVYRYLWDGARLVHEGTPYLHAPEAFFGQTLSSGESWLADGINYPHLPTVYGPLWILFGAFGWLLSPTSLIGWKFLLILFEALFLITTRTWWDSRALVAWITCPLWFWEILLQCHAEVFGVGFFILAFGLIRQRHFLRAGFFLALALGGRWSLLPPLLMIVVFARADFTARRNLIVGLTFGFLFLAFLLGVMGPLNFDGLEALYRDWQHNPIIWKWFATMPSMIWVLGLGGALLIYRRPWRDELSNLTLWSECFALWVLASTVINPWYLLWLLPGLVVSRERTWWGMWIAVIPVVYWQAQWTGDLHRAEGLHSHPDAVWWIQCVAMIVGGLRVSRVAKT
ncbi:MAG: hypothetical protein VX210_16940 [Myxococcota bacterium]|nr:hypothetical protein [Myxococcota bacterium]